MSLIGNAFRALRRPQPMSAKATWKRQIFRLPILFDLTSLYLQHRNRKRRAAIMDDVRSDDAYVGAVHAYNAGRTQGVPFTRTRRAESIYQIATAPARCRPNDERLLIVGPRDVHELFIAWTYGFRWENMTGIDLYSEDPRILVMNMEAMTFEADSFDCITMAHTLAYAKDTRQCLSECLRVLKPGGRLVFGATYFPKGTEWKGNAVPGDEIAHILEDLGAEIFHWDSSDKINALGGAQTSHLVGALKPDPENPGVDRVRPAITSPAA